MERHTKQKSTVFLTALKVYKNVQIFEITWKFSREIKCGINQKFYENPSEKSDASQKLIHRKKFHWKPLEHSLFHSLTHLTLFSHVNHQKSS